MKYKKIKEEFFKKFGVEQYDETLGFYSSGMTISSKEMWEWIDQQIRDSRLELKQTLLKRLEEEKLDIVGNEFQGTEEELQRRISIETGYNQALDKAKQIVEEME